MLTLGPENPELGSMSTMQCSDQVCFRPLARSLAAAFATLVGAPTAAAQSPTWLAQYGSASEDNVVAIVPTDGDGVFSCSSPWLFSQVTGMAAEGRIVRFDGLGNPISTTWIDSGAFVEDRLASATSDGAGGLYVCGSTMGVLSGSSAGGRDAWLARLDPTGSILWIRQLGTASSDSATSVATDGAGGLFVAGTTSGSLGGPHLGMSDVWYARFDPAGSLTWSRQIGTATIDLTAQVASDGSGGAFLGGVTYGSLGGSHVGMADTWFGRIDSSGNLLWTIQPGTPQIEEVSRICPNGNGGFYFGGHWGYPTGGQSGTVVTDAWLGRIDGAGNVLWTQTFGGNDFERATSVAPDGQGGVYVAGETDGALAGPYFGDFDAWVRRFDETGEANWGAQLGTTALDSAGALAAAPGGGFWIGGNSTGSLVIGTVNQGLNDSWVARFEDPCGTSTYCVASATSLAGCQAAIGATGLPSLGKPSTFTISSGSVPGGNNFGICLFGANGPAAVPFGTLGGQLCVQSPIFRTGPKSSGGSAGQCNGAYAFTLADLVAASPIVAPGVTLHAEFWARDPQNPDGFLLSNGLQFAVCP